MGSPHPGLLDGWAFDPNRDALMKADADRLRDVKALLAESGIAVTRRPNPQRARTEYRLELAGPADRLGNAQGFSVKIGSDTLTKRDLALLCDANLCFGGVVEWVRSSVDGTARTVAAKVDVYTD